MLIDPNGTGTETRTSPAPRLMSGRFRSRIDGALERAAEALLAGQSPEGWWVGEDEANCTLDAEYIFFFHFTGLIERPENREKMRRLANRIRGQQRADGTWAIYYGGPGEISCTTESYTALKLAGDSPDAPHMARAREFIRSKGGPLRARNLTRIQLALLGQMDWRACPSIPIQLMFAPKFSRFNIYEISYWARVCTVPLAMLCDIGKTARIPEGRGIPELFPEGTLAFDLAARERADFISWKNFFIQSDRFLKWAEKKNLLPFRKSALRRAEKWIRRHQDPSGDWGGIFPAMVNSLMALHARGMGVDDAVFKKGLEALARFEVRDSTDSPGPSSSPDQQHDELHIAPCVSPVWDTAWTVVALTEAGVKHEEPAIKKATAWLAKMQIRRRGDWRHKCPGLKPGGWAFQFYNDRYPDTDDASVVLMALLNDPRRGMGDGGADSPHAAWKSVFDRGVRWVLGLQNADGGWGAFERDVDDDIYNEILYNDEKNMLDPSTADVTGRVLECLGYCGIGPDDPIVARALAFVRREQETDESRGVAGSWWGRWGVNYVYGTWSVLRGLAALGFGADDPAVARAAAWLESFQNEDGGWGETCATYRIGSKCERAPSTASQTAWGVLGLIAAGQVRRESTRRGVEWLLAHQRTSENEPRCHAVGVQLESPAGAPPASAPSKNEGLWFERDFTGTGFPNAFYLRYHYYPVYFPILALAAYRNALAKDHVPSP
ncbi:squalene--hopene cyclase [bacterium]|nr:squalene--hopene cyclase [bacterium]